jgi:dinuclear metal center YbgI/SA1388 family protein
MQIREIISALEDFAPLSFQESYDNSGLCIDNPNTEAKAALLTIDITEDVIEEAKKTGCNIIISHHPLIFSGVKNLTGKNYTERCIIKAIKEDIAIYAAHTNIDIAPAGVSFVMAEKLGLQKIKVLSPLDGALLKLVTFVPTEHAEKVRAAIFDAGAGQIGNYDRCSYNVNGTGTFRGNEDSSPFVGKSGSDHAEPEVRIETILPVHAKTKVLKALLASHPYEEPAYDIYQLSNAYEKAGLGAIGKIKPTEEKDFLEIVKKTFQVKTIRHTPFRNRKIETVALCGGSGSSLLRNAIMQHADIYISGDFKYHQFFENEGRIVIADIGHFESEQFTKEIFYQILMKKFPTFAVHFSSIITNPINYF